MADPVIVNTPGNGDSSGNGSGFLLGVIILVLFILLFLVYGLPYIRSSIGTTAPQINVPDKVNVNVNKK